MQFSVSERFGGLAVGSATTSAALSPRAVLFTMLTVLICTIAMLCSALVADDLPAQSAPGDATAQAPVADAKSEPIPLNRQGTVLIDSSRKRLLLKTEVCLREGVLEMLMCLKKTKEHESVLSIDADAIVIHAGLLAIGAKPGHPARYAPEFTPPAGQKIEIYVNWTDESGKPQRRKAQDWVRRLTHRYFAAPLKSVPAGVTLDTGMNSLRYDSATFELLWYGNMSAEKKTEFEALSDDESYRQALNSLYQQSQFQPMEANWVFGGSEFSKLKDGQEWYQAQAGTVICVANFGDAMIDVDIQSSGNNSSLLFEPFTERIPQRGTEVLLELVPVFDAASLPEQPPVDSAQGQATTPGK